MRSSSGASRDQVGPIPLEQQVSAPLEVSENPAPVIKLIGEAWGALNFILAFYEPGQRYLDTEAWKVAEASGRRVHKALREFLDTHAGVAPADGVGQGPTSTTGADESPGMNNPSHS